MVLQDVITPLLIQADNILQQQSKPLYGSPESKKLKIFDICIKCGLLMTIKEWLTYPMITQPAITFSKLTIERLDQDVKYVQS